MFGYIIDRPWRFSKMDNLASSTSLMTSGPGPVDPKSNPWDRSVLEYLGDFSDDIFGLNKSATFSKNPLKVKTQLADQYKETILPPHCERRRVKLDEDTFGILAVPNVYCGVSSRPAADNKRILIPPTDVMEKLGIRELYVEVYDDLHVRQGEAHGWHEIKNGIFYSPTVPISEDFWLGKIAVTSLPITDAILSVTKESSSSSSSGSSSIVSTGTCSIASDWFEKYYPRKYNSDIIKLWEQGDGGIPALKDWSDEEVNIDKETYQRVAKYYVLVKFSKVDTDALIKINVFRTVNKQYTQKDTKLSWVEFAKEVSSGKITKFSSEESNEI